MCVCGRGFRLLTAFLHTPIRMVVHSSRDNMTMPFPSAVGDQLVAFLPLLMGVFRRWRVLVVASIMIPGVEPPRRKR